MSMTTNPTTLRTASLAVSESSVRAYAELSDDFNPIHVDAAFAATTAMGRQIAHGTMSLGLLWQCLGQNFGAESFCNLQLDLRFVKPVYIGDQLTAGGQPREGQDQAWDVWVRGADGSDRVVGALRLPATATQQEGEPA